MASRESSPDNEYHLTSIRFGPLADDVLERGSSLGVTAKRDLERFYHYPRSAPSGGRSPRSGV